MHGDLLLRRRVDWQIQQSTWGKCRSHHYHHYVHCLFTSVQRQTQNEFMRTSNGGSEAQLEPEMVRWSKYLISDFNTPMSRVVIPVSLMYSGGGALAMSDQPTACQMELPVGSFNTAKASLHRLQLCQGILIYGVILSRVSATTTK